MDEWDILKAEFEKMHLKGIQSPEWVYPTGLAKYAGVTEGAVRQWLKGTTRPRGKYIPKIREYIENFKKDLDKKDKNDTI